MADERVKRCPYCKKIITGSTKKCPRCWALIPQGNKENRNKEHDKEK